MGIKWQQDSFLPASTLPKTYRCSPITSLSIFPCKMFKRGLVFLQCLEFRPLQTRPTLLCAYGWITLSIYVWMLNPLQKNIQLIRKMFHWNGFFPQNRDFMQRTLAWLLSLTLQWQCLQDSGQSFCFISSRSPIPTSSSYVQITHFIQ